jgi:hypothetical protein
MHESGGQKLQLHAVIFAAWLLGCMSTNFYNDSEQAVSAIRIRHLELNDSLEFVRVDSGRRRQGQICQLKRVSLGQHYQ